MSESPRKRHVRALVDALNGRRLDELERYLAPGYVDRSAPPGADASPGGLRAGFEEWHRSFPDHRITIERLIEEGDYVATRATCEATHAGAYAGIAPTGRRVRFAAHELYRFDGDLICEHWEVWDEAALMRQLAAASRIASAAASC